MQRPIFGADKQELVRVSHGPVVGSKNNFELQNTVMEVWKGAYFDTYLAADAESE